MRVPVALNWVSVAELDVNASEVIDVNVLVLSSEGIVGSWDEVELEAALVLKNVDKIVFDEDSTVGMVHTLPVLLYEVVVDAAEVFGKSQDFVVFSGGVEVPDAKVSGLDISVALKFVDKDKGVADADVVLVSGTYHPVVILLWGLVNNDWDCVVAMVTVEFNLVVTVSLKNVDVDDDVVDEAFALDPDDIVVILELSIRVVD